MNVKLLCALACAAATALAVLTVPDGRVSAVPCQRTVSVSPQVSAAEGAGTLTFVVSTRGCAAAGYVSYEVTDGTARRPADFLAGNGQLQWGSGDYTDRHITVRLTTDSVTEAPLEDFGVTLVNPSPAVTVAAGAAQGRILDDDSPVMRTLVIDDQTCPTGALGLMSLDVRTCPMDDGNITFTLVRGYPGELLRVQLRDGGGVSTEATFPQGSYWARVTVGRSGEVHMHIVGVPNGITVLDGSAIGR